MIKFAVPLLLTSVLLQLFNTADTAMAGRFVGKEALAAVGGTVTISSFLIEFFLGFSNAVNVIIARLLGIFMGILGVFSVNAILKMMMIPDYTRHSGNIAHTVLCISFEKNQKKYIALQF